MIDLWEVSQRALALLILIIFLGLIYMKIRRQTVGETWEEINSWIGVNKK